MQYAPNTQMYLFLCSKQVKKRFFYIIYLKSVKGCSSVARLRLKAAGGNERRRRLLPCRVWPVQVAYARTCALKCSLNTRNSPFSFLFGAFNNNFKVFVFIGFVIIYFYNIFALIKKLFKFLSKILFTYPREVLVFLCPFLPVFPFFAVT